MRTMKRNIGLAARLPFLPLVLLIALNGCASLPPAGSDPAQTRAAIALQVLQRDQELQNAAITANQAVPKQLSDPDAIAIVRFTTTTADEVAKLPQGWVPVVKQAYANLKLFLASRTTATIASVFALIDALLAQVQ